MSESPVFRSPKPWRERYDTHVPEPWVARNRFLGGPREQRGLPVFSEARKLLPDPFWDGHAPTIGCYWRAWELAIGNLKQPTEDNGFVSNYVDTAFNGNLFMWDAAFSSCYGLYGRRVFDFIRTLDNFYCKQHADGFICREIAESDGQDTFQRFDPSSTGPNVLAWAEWNHFSKTGDRGRLEAVFPALVAYHHWTWRHRSWPDGSYWTTGWGSGMDNLPRLGDRDHEAFGNGHQTWVDATCQAILSAHTLVAMARVLGEEGGVENLQAETDRLTLWANEFLWDSEQGFYFDRLPNWDLSQVKHIGAYWALLAGIVPRERQATFIEHLDNEAEFKRPHPIPALSADDPDYDGRGGYWRGCVWPPTNYMVLKGLDQAGYSAQAHRIGRDHLEAVVKVFELEDTPWKGADQFREFFHLESLEFDDHHTLWENYAAEAILPAEHSKPGYVGWSGLPPIAVLFEDVFGLEPDASANRLSWRVWLTEEHGIRRYPFGATGDLDLTCKARTSRLERPTLEIHSNVPLILELSWEGGTETLQIQKEP